MVMITGQLVDHRPQTSAPDPAVALVRSARVLVSDHSATFGPKSPRQAAIAAFSPNRVASPLPVKPLQIGQLPGFLKIGLQAGGHRSDLCDSGQPYGSRP